MTNLSRRVFLGSLGLMAGGLWTGSSAVIPAGTANVLAKEQATSNEEGTDIQTRGTIY